MPLSTSLSHALVAFTIEFDNEFEHRSPHTATNHNQPGQPLGPWLVSTVI
ncbi:MAG TPA: hypothetical protein VKG79_00730 [Bryobacteraceae bacterium]|nr:hypothetical protein [Bryobacteraceae bacterium]